MFYKSLLFLFLLFCGFGLFDNSVQYIWLQFSYSNDISFHFTFAFTFYPTNFILFYYLNLDCTYGNFLCKLLFSTVHRSDLLLCCSTYVSCPNESLLDNVFQNIWPWYNSLNFLFFQIHYFFSSFLYVHSIFFEASSFKIYLVDFH